MKQNNFDLKVYFLEVAKGAHAMHTMLTKVKDQLVKPIINYPNECTILQKASPNVTDEILSSWEEFKKIFDEFDNDDGPKLDDIGRVSTAIGIHATTCLKFRSLVNDWQQWLP